DSAVVLAPRHDDGAVGGELGAEGDKLGLHGFVGVALASHERSTTIPIASPSVMLRASAKTRRRVYASAEMEIERLCFFAILLSNPRRPQSREHRSRWLPVAPYEHASEIS